MVPAYNSNDSVRNAAKVSLKQQQTQLDMTLTRENH